MLLQFLLLVLIKTSYGAKANYYVVGADDISCAFYSPCESLQYYASDQERYFTNSSSFKFLAGTHILNGSIYVHDVTGLAFMSNTSNVSVVCSDTCGGFIFERVADILLTNLSFINCGQNLPESLQREGEKAQATLAFGEVKNVCLKFVSVFNSEGYGLLGHCVYGMFSINHSTFSHNHGTSQYLGGNAVMEYTDCSDSVGTTLDISYSNFSNGYFEEYDYAAYSGTLATGLSIILSQTNTTVLLSNVVIEGNINGKTYKGLGGNLFIHFFNTTSTISNSVEIRECSLRNGTALYGAGIALSAYTISSSKNDSCENSLSIYSTEISHNQGVFGSGLFVNHHVQNDGECPRLKLI
jgi:hypothetical protein